jgi:hypothetical protein
MMGAEAIKRLLSEIDLDKEVEALKEELQTAQGTKTQPCDQTFGSAGSIPHLRQ